jgi:hypothetical protein
LSLVIDRIEVLADLFDAVGVADGQNCSCQLVRPEV